MFLDVKGRIAWRSDGLWHRDLFFLLAGAFDLSWDFRAKSV